MGGSAVRKAPPLGAESRIHARGEGILRATLEELAVVGYRALKIEEVAAKAGVNKTTVYRRWPTKKDLVQAALSSIVDDSLRPVDTGSLRGDLVRFGMAFVEVAASAAGQGLFRMMALERALPELEAIGAGLRSSHETVIASVLFRAVARGEIDARVDPSLVTNAMIGPLHLRLFLTQERVDRSSVTRLVDLLLTGLRGASPTPRKRR